MRQVAYFPRQLSVYVPLTEFGDNWIILLLRELFRLLNSPCDSSLKL